MQEQIISNVTARPQRVRYTPRRGTLIWILNRASAYGLILFLGVHLFLNFFVDVGASQTFEFVNRRFGALPLVYALNSFGLLITALFHGLSGLRSVFFDVVTSPGLRRFVTIVLLIIGVIALIDGSLSLIALMQLPATAG